MLRGMSLHVSALQHVPLACGSKAVARATGFESNHPRSYTCALRGRVPVGKRCIHLPCSCCCCCFWHLQVTSQHTLQQIVQSSHFVDAEPYLLLLQADGTLCGCSISQRNLVNLWTVPGELMYLPPPPHNPFPPRQQQHEQAYMSRLCITA